MTKTLAARLQEARARKAFYQRNGHAAQAAAARRQIAALEALIAARVARNAA